MENEITCANSKVMYKTGRDFFYALSSENETCKNFEGEPFSPYIHAFDEILNNSLDLSEKTRLNLKHDANSCIDTENVDIAQETFHCFEDKVLELNECKVASGMIKNDAISVISTCAENECNKEDHDAISVVSVETDITIAVKDILSTCLKLLETGSHNGTKHVEIKNNANQKGSFRCPICLKVISRKYNFKLHVMKHSKAKIIPKTVECDVCHKTIEEKRLLSHMNVHLKPHICYVCGRGFRLLWDLKHHIYTHTGERPYPCDVCGKKFGDKSARRKHYQTHTGEKPYSCEICQKAFAQLSHLREHKVTHTREKSHTCELCGKQFTTKSSLHRHIFTHSNTCEVCKETFSSEAHLSRHMELHNSERPYACSICDKRFTRKTDVHNHTKMHTAEKNKFCKICNQAFKSSKSLRIHHNKIHPGIEPPYACEFCSKIFFLECDFSQHLMLHEVKVENEL